MSTQGLAAVDRLIARHGGFGGDGRISPSGRLLATSFRAGDGFRLTLVDLITGKTIVLPGRQVEFNPNDQFTWLSQTSDRWLLAVTDNTLRIVDTRTWNVHTWHDVFVDRVTVTSS